MRARDLNWDCTASAMHLYFSGEIVCADRHISNVKNDLVHIDICSLIWFLIRIVLMIVEIQQAPQSPLLSSLSCTCATFLPCCLPMFLCVCVCAQAVIVFLMRTEMKLGHRSHSCHTQACTALNSLRLCFGLVSWSNLSCENFHNLKKRDKLTLKRDISWYLHVKKS